MCCATADLQGGRRCLISLDHIHASRGLMSTLLLAPWQWEGVAVLWMRHKPCQLAWKALETGEAAGSTTWRPGVIHPFTTARLSLTCAVLLYDDRQLSLKVK